MVHGAVEGLTPEQLAYRIDGQANSEPSATGYGHTTDDVAALRVDSPELLPGYYDAVHDTTVDYVQRLTDRDLARIVDESWTPPVSLGVRLVSVISDDLQHGGQAALLRGVLDRRARG